MYRISSNRQKKNEEYIMFEIVFFLFHQTLIQRLVITTLGKTQSSSVSYLIYLSTSQLFWSKISFKLETKTSKHKKNILKANW